MTGLQMVLAGTLALPVLWYIYWADGKAGRRPPDRSTGTKVRVFAAAAALFFLYYMAVSLAVELSGIPEKDAAFREAWAADAFSTGGLFLWAVVLAPVLEELLFRGILLRRAERAAGTLPAVLISALLFGLYHGNLSQGITAAAAGLALGYAYVRTDALLVSVVMHTAVNAAAFLLRLQH